MLLNRSLVEALVVEALTLREEEAVRVLVLGVEVVLRLLAPLLLSSVKPSAAFAASKFDIVFY